MLGIFILAVSALRVAPPPNDYGADASWLCRPGRHDACDVDLTATVVGRDGSLTRETWASDPDSLIDCFYVYPTVSNEPTPISDMTITAAERTVARQQLARFASKCRVYAPMYRQMTLAGLRQALAGSGVPPMDRGMSYDDVRDAWRHYLEHDNKGRGVVLIGHSQGSLLLTGLIRQEIDGKPAQARLVSALLIGTTVPVPRGKDVGGVFQHVPVCRSATETGCVVTYASFRATAPPPADALFGHVNSPAMAAACANPAALGGGAADLHSYFSVAAAQPWLKTSKPIDTPFVAMTDFVSARCASTANGTYLEITAPGRAPDSRGDHITGDVVIAGAIQPRWGLHLLDMAFAMGDMVDLVGRQAKAFEGRGR